MLQKLMWTMTRWIPLRKLIVWHVNFMQARKMFPLVFFFLCRVHLMPRALCLEGDVRYVSAKVWQAMPCFLCSFASYLSSLSSFFLVSCVGMLFFHLFVTTLTKSVFEELLNEGVFVSFECTIVLCICAPLCCVGAGALPCDLYAWIRHCVICTAFFHSASLPFVS